MALVFYDHTGRPTAYTENSDVLYSFNGRPVAYLDGDSLYSFSGKHLGWFDQGWVRDHQGACVFFTDHAAGSGPVKPVKHVLPVKSVKNVLPVRGAKNVKPVRSVDGLSWSRLSGDAFFQ